MNYYEKHLGDYAKDAGHISMLEHGAYNLLIDHYYATEKPIPADKVYKVAKALTETDRAAVDAVLAEFFTLETDGYHQKRCDEVIATFAEGEPDRELKKSNESSRQKKYREDRNRMFEALHAVGQFPPWNVAMAELRALYRTHCGGNATLQDASRNTSRDTLRDRAETVIRDRLLHDLTKAGQAPKGDIPLAELIALHQRWCVTEKASPDAPSTRDVTLRDEPATREATATSLQSPIPNPQSPIHTHTDARACENDPRETDGARKETEGTNAARVFDPVLDREGFKRVRAAYPKFAGRQDWIKAEHHCHLRLDEGETWETLRAAAERYAKYIRAKGCEGTQYVKTPSRYFDGSDADAYWRQEWEVPEPQAQGPTNGGSRRLTPMEIIEHAILDGRSDEEIAAMPELELVPTVHEDIRSMRQEIEHAQH